MNIIDMIKKNDYSVILCLGDSITEANHCTEGRLGYVGLLDDALRLACNKENYVVINAGMGGTRISQTTELVSGIVKRFKPQVTTVMYGMNDCAAGIEGLDKFAKSIELIVKMIRKQGSEVILLTLNPLDYSCNIEIIQRRPCLLDYMEEIRKCASMLKVELIDINAVWQRDILDHNNNEHFKLMHDGIHPNNHGHRFIFEQIKKLFG